MRYLRTFLIATSLVAAFYYLVSTDGLPLRDAAVIGAFIGLLACLVVWKHPADRAANRHLYLAGTGAWRLLRASRVWRVLRERW